MRTIIHSTEAATAFSTIGPKLTWLGARVFARPAHNGTLNHWNLLNNSWAVTLCALWHHACFALSVSGVCTIRRIEFYSFDYSILINVKVNLLTFGCFSFRMCNSSCPRCMHIHAIDPWADPSVAMHRVVHFLFVMCLFPVSEQLASIGPPAENCSKLNAIHSMRRDASIGKPDAPKRLPLALGFECTHCGCEFESRAGMAQHRRHSMLVWDPVCRSQKIQVHVIHRTRWSLRWDSSPTWYLRCVTHTVIVLLRKYLEHAQKMLTSPTVNSENSALIAIIEIAVIIVL